MKSRAGNGRFTHNCLDMNPPPFDPLDARVVLAALDAKAARFCIKILESCESTSTMLLDLAQRGASSGMVVACETQTAGRGRRGRAWLSKAGDSLTFSLLWRFPEGMPPPSGLSLAVGVAVARAMDKMDAAGVKLKWPNDILAGDGKLGGILVETLTAGRRHAAVIGIGLNVRLPKEIANRVDIEAAALDSVMPANPSRNLLLANLLLALADMLDQFEHDGFSAFVEEWLARHAHAGRSVRIIAEGAAMIEGRCAGIDADGALLLDTAHGIRRIVSGELSLRPA